MSRLLKLIYIAGMAAICWSFVFAVLAAFHLIISNLEKLP